MISKPIQICNLLSFQVAWYYWDSPEYYVAEDGTSVTLKLKRRGVLSGAGVDVGK